MIGYILDGNFNTASGWREVVLRRCVLMWDRLREFVRPGEMVRHRFDADLLGVRVGVCNTSRPEELLRKINERAFPTFAFTGVTVDSDGTHWTHFRAV